jgi:hypothetical protein
VGPLHFALITIPIQNVETELVVVPGYVIDEINERIGPYAFETMDWGLLAYTTVVETRQYLNEQGYYR